MILELLPLLRGYQYYVLKGTASKDEEIYDSGVGTTGWLVGAEAVNGTLTIQITQEYSGNTLTYSLDPDELESEGLISPNRFWPYLAYASGSGKGALFTPDPPLGFYGQLTVSGTKGTTYRVVMVLVSDVGAFVESLQALVGQPIVRELSNILNALKPKPTKGALPQPVQATVPQEWGWGEYTGFEP